MKEEIMSGPIGLLLVTFLVFNGLSLAILDHL